MARLVPILPDRLKPGLRLVFCGTAAGKQSALQKAYYANRQNKFWRTLHQAGLTPRLFEPHEFPQLWELGIGLTDIAKYHFGMDHQLPKDSFLGAGRCSGGFAPAASPTPRRATLAFTSLNAGRSVLGKHAVAGQQAERWGETQVWILPSPSPLADNHWDIAPWMALATGDPDPKKRPIPPHDGTYRHLPAGACAPSTRTCSLVKAAAIWRAMPPVSMRWKSIPPFTGRTGARPMSAGPPRCRTLSALP